MNDHTKQSREWRAEQRRLGRVPKLVWVHPLDWPKIQKLISRLKRKSPKPGNST